MTVSCLDKCFITNYLFSLKQEPTKYTPYFQMFNRNPCMPETSDILCEVDGDNTSMFAKIVGAIKEADKIMETKLTSVVKVILFNRKLCN